MQQASRQRLRWASGRHAVMTSHIARLFYEGMRRRRLDLLDAAATLLAPNYSSQASLTIVCLIASVLFINDPTWGFLLPWSSAVLSALGIYFLVGALLTESPSRTLAGLPLIPLFLPWRLLIEFLGFFGYGRLKWGQSARSAAVKPAYLSTNDHLRG
jgi:hypothetical protein